MVGAQHREVLEGKIHYDQLRGSNRPHERMDCICRRVDKEKRSWKLFSNFKILEETKNIKTEHRLRTVCLEEFMEPSKDEEEGGKWKRA